ncbi:MAG: hypothetical protein A2052_07430 [Deltaproteobacteria bacterium GWA2_54_12]|nr:MAG: hypothetical protein A2052_07430 [Deltaproteobacteria bacterium GWA2_54_12]
MTDAMRKRFSGKSVLVADNAEIVVDVLSEALRCLAGRLDTAGSGTEAFAKIMDNDFDIILLDILLPVISGMELYGLIKKYRPHLTTRIVFLTGDASSEEIWPFLSLCGCRFLEKPFSLKDLAYIIPRN